MTVKYPRQRVITMLICHLNYDLNRTILATTVAVTIIILKEIGALIKIF